MIDLSRLGIDSLSPMQQATAKAFRESDNIVLLSPTGSGKTLAYLVPLLESLTTESVVQALIVVPSRELAMQTMSVVKQTGTSVRCTAVYGGRPTMDEHRVMNGLKPQVIVGTPGRLLDHMTKGNFQTDSITTLVLDEFDKCLELGFREEMSRLFAHLGHVRKRVLLSATDNEEITRFLPQYTRLDYLGENATEERIEQWILHSPDKDKLFTLKALLMDRGQQSSIVFVGFRESVERVAGFLRNEGFIISALHGGMEQRERERQLFRFISGSTNILVSTDLAARGLDIPALDNVIHYHLPLNEEALVHRNGRTARWNSKGCSIAILSPDEEPRYSLAGSSVMSLPERRIARPPMPLWTSLYIGKGKKDKISRGDVAGFVMKIGGLKPDEVGRIDVRDHHCFVAVLRTKATEALRRMRGQKIKGIRTIIEQMK